MTNPTDPRVEAATLALLETANYEISISAESLRAHLASEHYGDCTKASCPCMRCICEEAQKEAVYILKAADEAAWRPIETAPTGANGVAWMQLAKVDGEETFTWSGMHCRGKFYAAGVFHKGGDVPYEFRQHEVHPTYWRPEQAPPKAP